MTGHFILLGFLMVLSGFFSSSETALFSLGRSKTWHLAKSEGRINQLIFYMKQDPHRLLSTILIGNNLVNIGASSLATVITIHYFPGGNAVGIATGIMTLLVLVFGEIFPKTVATQNNVLVSQIVIMPIYWLSYVFLPVIWMLNFIPRLAGVEKGAPPVTEDELITFVDVVHEDGEINPDERELIYNVIKLDDLSVSEIMTPSADMFFIDQNRDLELDRIIDSGYTRIPVVDGNIDNTVGLINVKDLFSEQVKKGGVTDIQLIIREPYFVPEYKKLDQLLKQFKRKKEHAAIVVNEYGEVVGMITLEDVLEAIVGDIVDETDIVKPKVVKVKENEWLVSGSADVRLVNEKLHTEIPESGDYETFSGFILEQIGRIPTEQEQIVFDGYIATVKLMEGNRIKSFIVSRK